MIQATDGFFYGTTAAGGVSDNGTIFRMDAAGNVSVLHRFTGLDGAGPSAELLEAGDGYMYGTTAGGGLHFSGTAFRIDALGNFQTLHDFDFGVDGGSPTAALIRAADGLFYGTTIEGGPGDSGTIFRFDADGTFETLHAFQGTDGAVARAALLQVADGSFYGTTASGGTYGGGTAFRFDLPDALTTFHSFSGDNEGSAPQAPFIQASDGYLYTTAASGGHGHGAIFRMDLAGNITTLSLLIGYEAAQPEGPLVEAPDGFFYGSGQQTVFRMDHSGMVTIVCAFDPAESAQAQRGVTLGADGRLYGVSIAGGKDGIGFLFSSDTEGSVTILHPFTEEIGQQPLAGLIQAPDGFFYGANAAGGTAQLGTVFKMSAVGKTALFHGFAPADLGSNPQATLLRASDGRTYGTTGAFGSRGTLFRLDGTGALTTLHLYGPGNPPSTLVEASNGLFYGTTPGGGGGQGTIFRVNADSSVVTIHAFSGAEGSTPQGALLQASDGNLYGTTSSTIYRANRNGDVTVLHTFSGFDEGYDPIGSLVQASDGNLYGTTSLGGSNGFGTIFRIGLSGAFATIHAFDQQDGANPEAGLMQASDGYLYGTTIFGGGIAGQFGTIFKTDLNGNLSTICGFAGGSQGSYPQAALLQGVDGNLYGTAGVVFRLILANFAATRVTPSSGDASGGTRVQIFGAGFTVNTQAQIGGGGTASSDVTSSLLFGVAPALQPGTLNDVVVMDGGSTATLAGGFFADFADVSGANPFHDAVESLVRYGISAGCGGGSYCPGAPVTRAQASVLLLKAEHGRSFQPPSCTGVFADVPCPGPFADWIEALAAEGITGGCGGGNFCPGQAVSRAQTTVLLLKTSHGPTFSPPACVGAFADVACPSLFADWIEEAAAEGITSGCSSNPPSFCPSSPTSRGQSAALLARAFRLP